MTNRINVFGIFSLDFLDFSIECLDFFVLLLIYWECLEMSMTGMCEAFILYFKNRLVNLSFGKEFRQWADIAKPSRSVEEIKWKR